ncbi:hypothetical protein SADUNF_Sadunf01G0040300 [Salix dunnii]|uniref:S-protein homolog n=1 Tax=Salix dunnii TaxID=1413687 RepID=A0A835N9G2_9ROSI|nr:hypothetical protein SADUNF_Sadunf01G0040300 [Salix dunnii]
MKKVLTKIFLVVSLAIGLIFMSINQSEYFCGLEYDVRVINGFTNNSSLPLVIWCSSDSNDLGGRALQEGDDFSWRLQISFWCGNHFWCTVKWDAKRRRFDAFKVPRDLQRCSLFRKCSWLVREDGFYFSNDEVNPPLENEFYGSIISRYSETLTC